MRKAWSLQIIALAGHSVAIYYTRSSWTRNLNMYPEHSVSLKNSVQGSVTTLTEIIRARAGLVERLGDKVGDSVASRLFGGGGEPTATPPPADSASDRKGGGLLGGLGGKHGCALCEVSAPLQRVHAFARLRADA